MNTTEFNTNAQDDYYDSAEFYRLLEAQTADDFDMRELDLELTDLARSELGELI